MMAINSLSASSYGLSGLVSGMDSQSMVEKLLSGTQAKIDAKSQQKSVLQMKQQLYRDVAAKLKGLQTQFLSFTSGTNLLSSSFYDTMTATLSPPPGTSAAFGVTASSGAKVGNNIMQQISQLATARTYKTGMNTASGAVIANMDQASAANLLASHRGADALLTVQVGNEADGYKTVSFANAPEQFAGKAPSEVVAMLNEAFELQGVGAEARFVNNKLQIIADNAEHYVSVHGNQAEGAEDPTLAMLMFGTGSSALSGKGTFSATIDTDQYMPGFEVNLDGRRQTIHIDLAALETFATTGDATAMMTDLSTKLSNTFGSGVSLRNVGGEWQFSTGNSSQKLSVTGTSDVMGVLGMTSGISNKLNSALSLADLNFATELQGNQHTFTINDVEFSFTSSTTLSEVINAVNSSKAGVKISYLEAEDRFVVQNAETGEGSRELSISQSEGNILSVLLGADGANSVLGYGVNMEMKGAEAQTADYATGGTFSFEMNGRSYKFTVPKKVNDETYSIREFTTAMNRAFADSFGVKSDGTQNIEFRLNSDNSFSIRTNDKKYNITALPVDENTNTAALGFTAGQSTLVTDRDVTLADAGIQFGDNARININMGGAEVSISNADADAFRAGAKLQDLSMDEMAQLMTQKMQQLAADEGIGGSPSVSYDEKTAAFRVMGVDIPMEIAVEGDADSVGLANLFGRTSLKTGTKHSADFDIADLQTDAGQNAKFRLNGQDIERASNTFTIEGLTYTLYNTTFKEGSTTEHQAPTSVNVSRDTDKIVKGFEEFLKLYNETMDFLYGLMRADPTYKDYPPLTEKQKSEMSDREIEIWEERSKEGLLRSDSYVEKAISTMRSIMYSKPDGSGIAIYDLGITTSYTTSSGNLNPKSMDNLRAAIEADPEGVRNLFAGEGGLMEQLNNAINAATSNSYGSPGYLTQVAGANALDTSSTIYKELKEMDEQLLSLEDRYWREYDRHWKQFNAMEQMIQQMNTQSSWLSQQLGG